MKQIFEAIGALGALAAGAGAMYYLDPQLGRRRRAQVRDKAERASHELRDYATVQAKRAADKGRGMVATIRSRRSTIPLNDIQLNERVRSRLGRLVTHPRAVETQVDDGCLHLRGTVLNAELGPLMSGLWAIPGVRSIDNGLTLLDEPANEPALKGGADERSRGLSRLKGAALPIIAIATPIAIALGTANHSGRRRSA